MLIGFVGCPSSGKTTTAAYAFAKWKEFGVPVEFIPEQARFFIAKKRIEKDLLPTDPLTLTDQDQKNIFAKQVDLETTMLKACGKDVIVLCDSSCLNTLLYMSESAISNPTLISKHTSRYDLLFYCPPIRFNTSTDPNRIHSESQSLAIDTKIPNIVKKWAPNINLIPLSGTCKDRYEQVLSAYNRHIISEMKDDSI